MEAIKHHGNNLQHNGNKVAIDNLVNEIVMILLVLPVSCVR